MKEKESLKEKLYWFWRLNIVDKYSEIIYWFKINFKKRFFNIILTCFRSYPWDYEYLWQLEEIKIKEMLDYQEHSHILCEESREHIIRTMKWALSMLYIIRHDTDYFHYTGEIKTIPLKEVDENGEQLYQYDGSDLIYHCDCKVNTKNWKRFRLTESFVKNSPHELYVEKARCLYHKIRNYYEQYWWV